MTVKHRLILDIQYEFNRTYPYLKIEFTRSRAELYPDSSPQAPGSSGASVLTAASQQDETTRQAAKNLLWKELKLSDDMKVSELEVMLQYEFGLPFQVLRKSGNLWLETRMTRHWTLRQQNNYGQDLLSIVNY